MIKFFRNIRQQLLSQNRFSKYLLYAIGEIVLVVVGILIALSINNWNEDKKERQKETKSLVELKDNLKSNIDEFNKFMSIQNESIENISMIVKYKEANLNYHDSIRKYFRGIGFLEQINITSSSYETMKTNGLDLISSDALRLEIIELYDVHYNHFDRLIQNVGLALFSGHVLPIRNKYYLINERYESEEFLYFLKDRISWKKDAIEYCEVISQRTKELIKSLEEELDKTD
ncbi:DUF6090 family protein [Aestuariivivens sediminicola]|uniref:DUF6090 family protein n=1 Tax=Aestuariivivens sediminicola TaxID=2913560 RepID=UPI001F5A5D86|nr:DUF6090 family protein [Aestuariivivens sediminicola]